MNRYRYHYCAVHEDGSRRTYVDGIALMEDEIKTHEGYQKFKALIDAPSPITIISLTPLGREE